MVVFLSFWTISFDIFPNHTPWKVHRNHGVVMTWNCNAKIKPIMPQHHNNHMVRSMKLFSFFISLVLYSNKKTTDFIAACQLSCAPNKSSTTVGIAVNLQAWKHDMHQFIAAAATAAKAAVRAGNKNTKVTYFFASLLASPECISLSIIFRCTSVSWNRTTTMIFGFIYGYVYISAAFDTEISILT